MEELSFAAKLRHDANANRRKVVDEFVKISVKGCINAIHEEVGRGAFSITYNTKAFPTILETSKRLNVDTNDWSVVSVMNSIREELIAKGLNEVYVTREPYRNYILRIKCRW